MVQLSDEKQGSNGLDHLSGSTSDQALHRPWSNPEIIKPKNVVELDALIRSGLPTMVIYGAKWCALCHEVVEPGANKLAENIKGTGRGQIIYVDVESGDFSSHISNESPLPVIEQFISGTQTTRAGGAVGPAVLADRFEQNINARKVVEQAKILHEGVAPERAVEGLLKVIRDGKKESIPVEVAIHALIEEISTRHTDKVANSYIAEMLSHKDRDIAYSMAHELASAKDEQAQGWIIKSLTDGVKNPKAFSLAIQSMQQNATTEFATQLLQLTNTGNPAGVRHSALFALYWNYAVRNPAIYPDSINGGYTVSDRFKECVMRLSTDKDPEMSQLANEIKTFFRNYWSQ